MRNSSGVVVLALAVATSAKAQQPGALDSVFAAYDRTDRPGCAMAVSRNGQVLAARGFGMSDLAQSLAITPRSVFHVASVSNGGVVRSGNGEPSRYARVEPWSSTPADRAGLAGRYTSDEIGTTRYSSSGGSSGRRP